jgi:hypothetical protein
MVVVDLLVDEESTTTIVDEGASLFGRANSFGLVGLLFTISSCRQKMYFFYMFSLKNTSSHAHTKSKIGHLPYVVGNSCNRLLAQFFYRPKNL